MTTRTAKAVEEVVCHASRCEQAQAGREAYDDEEGGSGGGPGGDGPGSTIERAAGENKADKTCRFRTRFSGEFHRRYGLWMRSFDQIIEDTWP